MSGALQGSGDYRTGSTSANYADAKSGRSRHAHERRRWRLGMGKALPEKM